MGQKKKIAIMASGRGSNTQAILNYAKEEDSSFEITLIISNRKDAGVLQIGKKEQIPTRYITRAQFYKSEELLQELQTAEIDMVVLAGFLWLIPDYLITAYPNKILNIHPALLPKHGGKGMYGSNVHQAVKEANDIESGITIHFVNEAYDEGNIIFQAHCQLSKDDTSDEIAARVLSLEHHFFAKVIDGVTKNLT